MKNRLILIEGIPGSGKTTIANKLKEHLENKGVNVKLYSEGDSHPADMAWNAFIPLDEYKELLDNNPQHEDLIKRYSIVGQDYALVAYTKLAFTPNENELMNYFEEHEVYDGRVSLDVFKKLHFERWKEFGLSVDKDEIVIFECAFLQNHINELLGAHTKDIIFIKEYMLKLIENVKELNPKLIYLNQQSVYETIKRVAETRVSQDKSKWQDWIDLVIKYVEDSVYGKQKNLKGFDGIIEFFETRKKIELAVINELPIDKVIINNLEYNWEDVFEQVLNSL